MYEELNRYFNDGDYTLCKTDDGTLLSFSPELAFPMATIANDNGSYTIKSDRIVEKGESFVVALGRFLVHAMSAPSDDVVTSDPENYEWTGVQAFDTTMRCWTESVSIASARAKVVHEVIQAHTIDQKYLSPEISKEGFYDKLIPALVTLARPCAVKD